MIAAIRSREFWWDVEDGPRWGRWFCAGLSVLAVVFTIGVILERPRTPDQILGDDLHWQRLGPVISKCASSQSKCYGSFVELDDGRVLRVDISDRDAGTYAIRHLSSLAFANPRTRRAFRSLVMPDDPAWSDYAIRYGSQFITTGQ